MSNEEKQVMKLTPQELEAQKALMGSTFTGNEDTTSSMLNNPFLKIAQSTSTQLDTREDKNDPLEPGQIAGLRPGMFFNSQTGKIYPSKNGLNVIALYAKDSYLHFGKKLGDFRGEYKNIAEVEALVKKGALIPNEKGLGWTDPDEGKCMYGITFLVFLPDHPEEGILPFLLKSKSIKYAKNWSSLSSGMMIAKLKRVAKRYELVWNIKIKDDEGQGKKFKNIGNSDGTGITFVGNIYEIPEYGKILPALKQAVDFVARMRAQGLKINYSNATGDEEIPNDSGDDSSNPFDDK